MTDIETRMRTLLTQTGLYTGQDTIFSAEMASYAVGLQLLHEAIEKLRQNIFVLTADADGLTNFENLFRCTPSSDTEESRRAMLLQRGSVTLTDYTRAALEKMLLAAGIEGGIVENFQDGLYVNVLGLLGISQKTAESEARRFMPAHLPCVFDFGVNTWDAVDARDLTFTMMDIKNLTWAQIDTI